MTVLLELKEKMKAVYGKYGIYIQPLCKFLIAVCVFASLNSMLGYMKQLTNIFILLILSLLCAILPLGAIVLFGGILIVAHCFALGLEVGAAALILILLIYLLYFRYVPGDALAFILSPVAGFFGMPAAVPMGLGLLREPISAVSGSAGILLYYFLKTVKEVIEPLKQTGDSDLMKSMEALADGLLNNRQMLVILVACAAVTICMSLIRKLSIDYAWYIAVGAGALCFVIIAAGGGIALRADLLMAVLLAGTLGAAVISVILEFFFFHVDYRHTEYLQYQDDEYVYYVKAVPKIAGNKAAGNEEKLREEVSEEERETERIPQEELPDFSEVDFTAKLEASLKEFEPQASPEEAPPEEVPGGAVKKDGEGRGE